MTDSSILVVGATGSVGSELVKQLAATNRRPRALVRDESKAASLADLATPVIGDLAAPESLASAFEGAERVFVLAPPTPELEMLAGNAIDAAAAAGAKRIVYLSGLGTGEIDDSHFRAHAASEQRLAALDVEWTVLRPARYMSYTPFVWSSVLQRDLLLETGGEGTMTVFDPADVAAIGALVLTEDGHAGQTYKLTSEDAITAAQLAEMLSAALGRELTIFEGDTEALRVALEESGAPGEFAPLMAGYFDSVREGFWSPIDTAEKLLGRKPTSYAEWLEANLPGVLSMMQAAS